MPKPRPLLKPSGYDVVIRNRNAIRAINRKLARASPSEGARLVDEKDRLMREMWAACPHDAVIYDPAMKTTLGPKPLPTRLCTGCGLDESSRAERFKTLKTRKGRTIERLEGQAFAIKLGQVLRATGINVENG